jgi:Tfp pilus assembly protein PilO
MARNIPTPKAGAQTGRASASLRARAGRFVEARQRSVLGMPEVVALVVAAVMLAAALAAFFLYLRPQQARFASLSEEQGRLERQLAGARDEGLKNESTQESVERILASLQEFESRRLGENTQQSEWDMVGKLNDLLQRHGLEPNAKLSYTPFAVGGRQPAQAGTSRPIQAVFPGIGISLTVEGNYQSLRRFITDVESDPRFIVINSVELESITDPSAPVGPVGVAPGDSPAPAPTSRGALVSLRLDMAAYFRRGGDEGAAPEFTDAQR